MPLTQQTLRSVENPDRTLVTHTAAAGSPAQEALSLLAQLVGTGHADIATGDELELITDPLSEPA